MVKSNLDWDEGDIVILKEPDRKFFLPSMNMLRKIVVEDEYIIKRVKRSLHSSAPTMIVIQSLKTGEISEEYLLYMDKYWKKTGKGTAKAAEVLYGQKNN